ncbi:TIGR02452 family protein [Kutzneria sp. CA-103260]|uniref:TIGR02452 family protein n=1 Tax=Kutzneria sp. CA-103260 TaxID=2802641 RepID=UPI001BAC9ECA|nr:TIGR02452 family protein [Kutzneria sp. CA-103260]
MTSRLRAIAADTVAICDRGSYEAERGPVRITVNPASTRLHGPDEPLSLPAQQSQLPRIDVTNESTLHATRRLDNNVAALVFASARNPGGGFLNGAQAQEESIARSSALHPYLLAANDFYAHHRADSDLTYSDRVIYSPDVPVFRDDHGALLAEPYAVSFLTAAAPNRAAVISNQPERAEGIPAILRRRAARVLQVAAAHGHRNLVLGAWGCGVFGNEPATVAEAFREAIDRNRFFDHIVFAVLGAPTLAAFQEGLR